MNTPRADETRSTKPLIMGYFVESSSLLQLDRSSVRDVAGVLRRWWLPVAGIAIAGVLFGALAFVAQHPTYRAQVVTVPRVNSMQAGSALLQQLGGLVSLTGIAPVDMADELQAALAYAQSREFAAAFISERNLLTVLFADDWDADAGFWQADVPTIGDAVELFRDDVLRVSRSFEDGTVTFEVEWRDPVAAADWANEIVARVNEYMRKAAIDQALRSIEYLYQQLAETTVLEVRQSIYELIETHIKSRVVAAVTDEYVFRVIDPAVAPDKDKYIRPNLIAYTLGGFILGALLAMPVAVFLERSRPRPADQR